MASFFASFIGDIAGERGEEAVILEIGDGELAAGDGVAARFGGVLAGYGNLAGQAPDLHGLEGAEGGAVVGGHDRVELALGGGQDVLHRLLGVGGDPSSRPTGRRRS